MTRHEPPFRWQMDWTDTTAYSHPSADLTPNLEGFGLSCGAVTTSGGFGIDRTSGTLTLRNRGGIYNPDSPNALGPFLDHRHRCRRIESGTVIWEGFAVPSDLRSAQEDEPVSWRLEGLEAVAQDRDVSLFQEGGDLATAATFVAETSGMTFTTPDHPTVGVAAAEESAVNVAAMLCRWAGCIGFEQPDDGSIIAKSFPALVEGTDAGTAITFDYEPDYPPTVQFQREMVRNAAIFESRSVVVDDEPSEVARILTTVPTHETYFSVPIAGGTGVIDPALFAPDTVNITPIADAPPSLFSQYAEFFIGPS